jgi:all-trans-8'-apo-beta-carotenal 15,15'-oxygenase
MVVSLLVAVFGVISVIGSNTLNFLRSTNETGNSVLLNPQSAWLEHHSHYRLLPGVFPKGMNYHFDGFATVMQFKFEDGKLSYTNVRYKSNLEQHWGNCIFEGTGTGPTIGTNRCLRNPGVNLLPINNQLWLTIDTSSWGRVDIDTLATVTAKVDVPSTVLNAHPACDAQTHECFVQYPCGYNGAPLTNIACVGLLQTGESNMQTVEVSRVKLPKAKLIQHSHSPCITPNYFVSKLDSFAKRGPNTAKPSQDAAGLLKLLHQYEDNVWLVMDRRTNTSTLLYSDVSFVNNHFWNCVERDGKIVVDAVAATGDYLDTYFRDNLAKQTNWTKMFQQPLRCRVPIDGSTNITCTGLLKEPSVVFDYPTFNPYFKMIPEYQWYYGIAPVSPGSQWFDRLLKISSIDGAIAAQWSQDGVYLTEAGFIPRGPDATEDDGFLVSVIYHSHNDTSSLALFNATNLQLADEYPLDQVIPFHAHGVSCVHGTSNRCFTNP